MRKIRLLKKQNIKTKNGLTRDLMSSEIILLLFQYIFMRHSHFHPMPYNKKFFFFSYLVWTFCGDLLC